jgi:hypothetical protein
MKNSKLNRVKKILEPQFIFSNKMRVLKHINENLSHKMERIDIKIDFFFFVRM